MDISTILDELTPLTCNWSSHSQYVECLWDPSILSPTNHTIMLTLSYEEDGSNPNSARTIQTIRTIRTIRTIQKKVEFNLAFLSLPSPQPSPSATHSAHQLQVIQPRRALLLPLFSVLALIVTPLLRLLCRSDDCCKRISLFQPLSLLYQRWIHFSHNRSVLLGLTLFSIALLVGPFLCGPLQHSFIIACAWGTVIYSEGKWRYAFWMDIRVWSYYLCLICLLPLIAYVWLHCQVPSFRSMPMLMLFYTVEGLCAFVPLVTSVIIMGLMMCNYPLPVLLLSLNMMWTPFLATVYTLRHCKRSRLLTRKHF